MLSLITHACGSSDRELILEALSSLTLLITDITAEESRRSRHEHENYSVLYQTGRRILQENNFISGRSQKC